VVGSPRAWPHVWAFWLLPKRVKSGMFRDSVDQKPIMPIREGQKTFQKLPPQPSFEGWSSSGPKPPALTAIHHSITNAPTSTKGAAQFSKRRRSLHAPVDDRDLEHPEQREDSHIVQAYPPICEAFSQLSADQLAGEEEDRLTADPGLDAEPAAGHGARTSAGRLAPRTPNEARAKTGKGMPYLGPA
jgi:hypothetical protein